MANACFIVDYFYINCLVVSLLLCYGPTDNLLAHNYICVVSVLVYTLLFILILIVCVFFFFFSIRDYISTSIKHNEKYILLM